MVLDYDTQTSDQFQLVVHGSRLIDSMTSLRSLPEQCNKTADNAPEVGCTRYFENGRTAVIRLLKGDIDQPQRFPLQTRVQTNAGDRTMTLYFAHPASDTSGVPDEKNWVFRDCGLPPRTLTAHQ